VSSRPVIFRIFVDSCSLLAGIAATVLVARYLGPSGKGVQAVLALLTTLLVRISALGLGDAATVLARPTDRNAWSAAFAVSLVASCIGGVACMALGVLLVSPASADLWTATVLAAAAIPLGVLLDTASRALVARMHVTLASGLSLVVTLSSLGWLLLFLVVFHAQVAGAIASGLAGVFTAIVLGARPILQVLPRPFVLDYAYLRKALRFGLQLELSYVLTGLSNRVDLFLVYGIIGSASAGIYSVALTGASVVFMVPFALSYVAFPRQAQATARHEALRDPLRVTRVALVLSAATAVGVSCLGAFAVPWLLGPAFAPAIVPLCLISAGTIASGGQWVLGRTLAAIGAPTALLTSYFVSVVVMVVFDALAVPAFGLHAAALGNFVSSVVGFVIAGKLAHRHGLHGLRPRRSDLRFGAQSRRHPFS
jgi:stage V sporulation protein B